jgi:hypothetical protein
LGNLVWIDNGAGNPANLNNGKQDAGEIGLNGVTIRVLDGSGNLVATTTTANNPSTGAPGWYTVGNLVPGSYQVEFVLPNGYVFSQQGTIAQTSGSPSDTSNSQPTVVNPKTVVVSLLAGNNNPQLDAGIVPISALPVPALGQYMQLLLVLMLFGFAVLSQYRQRRQ